MGQLSKQELKQLIQERHQEFSLEEKRQLMYGDWLKNAPHTLASMRIALEPYMVEVAQERLRQHSKWGEQNHTAMHWLPILMEEVGELSQATLEAHFKNAYQSQYPDAVAGDYSQARLELVQVAAVAISMLQSIDRNELKEKPPVSTEV